MKTQFLESLKSKSGVVTLIFSFLMGSYPLFGQQSRPLTPIAGHYRQLVALSPEPRPNHEGIDRKQFPSEGVPEKDTYSFFKKLTLKPVYLDLPVSFFQIGEFPANSSVQTQAEVDFLLMLQKTARTPEKVKESLLFADVYYLPGITPVDPTYAAMRQNLFHMGRQLGWFTPEKLPVTADFIANVWSDSAYYFWALKLRYNRTRPYMLDTRVRALDTATNFPAYPSAHAAASYVAAYVYQELLPEHTELFLKNADDMAYSREILGVHFPSDTEAGRVFARQFVNELCKNEHFKSDFAKAQAELQRVQASYVKGK